MTNLIPHTQAPAPVVFDDEGLAVLRHTIAKECSDGQFRLFLEVCKQTGLNPFDRQIYPVVRQQKLTIQTGIDGYRLQAARTGEYTGSKTMWCGPDGDWRDVWLDDKVPPAAAKTVVFRNGEPYEHIAKWSEYHTTIGDMWKKMPTNMLGKCSEAGALRKAFPAELARMLVDAEQGAIDHVYEADDLREKEKTPPKQPERASDQEKKKKAGAPRSETMTQPPPRDDVTEDGEVIEGEVVQPAAETDAAVPFGDFWNLLGPRLKGLAMPSDPEHVANVGDVAGALELGDGAGLKAVQKWYEDNGSNGSEAVDFICDALAGKGFVLA